MKYTQGQTFETIIEDGNSLWFYTDDTATYEVIPHNVTASKVTGTKTRADGVVKLGPYYQTTVVRVTATSGDMDVRNYEFAASPIIDDDFSQIMSDTGMSPDATADAIRNGRTPKSIAELQSLRGMSSGDTAYLSLGGRSGPFQWDGSDLSVKVAADPLQGVYIAPASDVTGASGAWVRHLRGAIAPEMWGGAADWDGATGTDSYAAWAAAIAYAKLNRHLIIKPDSGCYYSSQNWPVIDEPIAIVGEYNTFVQFAPNAGQAVTVRNCGFDDESVFFVKTADRAFTNFSDVKLPVTISGISLLGDRSVSGTQHGIVFEGNNDYVHLDVECWYFNGRGAWFGKSYAGERGNVREFSKCRVRTRLCGRTDSTASVTFEVANAAVKDSSNLIKPLDIECVFPFGHGVEFVDNRADSTGSGLYGFIGDVMVHGPNFTSQNGTLLRFVGRVTDVNLRTNIAYDETDNKSISFDKNYTNNEYPRNINLSITAPSSNKVFEFKHGAAISVDYMGGYSRKELGEVGSNFEGPLTINVFSNGHLLDHAASFTINSTTPVSLTSWDGGYLGVAGFPTFFGLQSATGDGDTIRATVRGIIGVITRSGDATAGADSYTFTADSASAGYFVPANSKFSKFVVSSAKQAVVSGRYLGSEVMQYGLQSPAEYNADGKLKIGFYSLWNQGTLLRKKYGEPTSSTDGEAIGQWYKLFVGSSSTPSVIGASLLYANYASPTNLTNMTGGVDGQRVTIVAENANCTIVNGATMLTNSGANIALSAGKAVSFIYSSGLSAWVQC